MELLPAGMSISSSGLVSGTPTTTVTVTASSGSAAGSAPFGWTVNPAGGGSLNGAHRISLSGRLLRTRPARGHLVGSPLCPSWSGTPTSRPDRDVPGRP
ncbi:putative Ig domain-containing protein [Streptacidiphilus sp. EB129]|uniref:putative Ig domain-containing protein n=1 Tax=Streptacidiphilus sp. EB129 TaxID=3156262 RepID=UPI00351176A3